MRYNQEEVLAEQQSPMDFTALKQIKSLVPHGGTLIFLTKFGSHLYGTHTEQSDTDYKGIYVPSYRDMILGNVKKTIHSDTGKAHGQKNTKDDVDVELISIQKFIHEARVGETMALDMLHASDECIEYFHPAMGRITSNRTNFYTKNLKAFVSYARKQAAKYGLKGSRLDALRNVLGLIDPYSSEKMEIVWDKLPVGEHTRHIFDTPNGVRQYEICGKVIQSTSKCAYVHSFLTQYYSNYGSRAVLAQQNEGVDWKAISHAFRAAYQVQSILTTGTLSFPLRQAPFLRSIKLGQIPYVELAPELETLIEELDVLYANSALPEEVPVGLCNNLTLLVVTDVNGMHL